MTTNNNVVTPINRHERMQVLNLKAT